MADIQEAKTQLPVPLARAQAGGEAALEYDLGKPVLAEHCGSSSKIGCGGAPSGRSRSP